VAVARAALFEMKDGSRQATSPLPVSRPTSSSRGERRLVPGAGVVPEIRGAKAPKAECLSSATGVNTREAHVSAGGRESNPHVPLQDPGFQVASGSRSQADLPEGASGSRHRSIGTLLIYRDMHDNQQPKLAEWVAARLPARQLDSKS